jgi:hypothetical protein
MVPRRSCCSHNQSGRDDICQQRLVCDERSVRRLRLDDRLERLYLAGCMADRLQLRRHWSDHRQPSINQRWQRRHIVLDTSDASKLASFWRATPTGSGVTSIGADLLACPPNGSTSTLGPRDYYNNSISTVCGGIYFVNHGGAYSLTSAATSFVLTTPSSLVNGNVLIAEITCLQGTSSSNSLTPPSGFTQIGSTTNLLYADGVYKNDAVYYHVVSGGEASSYTFTSVNACTGSGDIMQLSGGAGTYSYVVGPQAKVNTNATSTSISISGVGETYQSGEFAFYLGAMGNSAARQR